MIPAMVVMMVAGTGIAFLANPAVPESIRLTVAAAVGVALIVAAWRR